MRTKILAPASQSAVPLSQRRRTQQPLRRTRMISFSPPPDLKDHVATLSGGEGEPKWLRGLALSCPPPPLPSSAHWVACCQYAIDLPVSRQRLWLGWLLRPFHSLKGRRRGERRGLRRLRKCESWRMKRGKTVSTKKLNKEWKIRSVESEKRERKQQKITKKVKRQRKKWLG